MKVSSSVFPRGKNAENEQKGHASHACVGVPCPQVNEWLERLVSRGRDLLGTNAIRGRLPPRRTPGEGTPGEGRAADTLRPCTVAVRSLWRPVTVPARGLRRWLLPTCPPLSSLPASRGPPGRAPSPDFGLDRRT